MRGEDRCPSGEPHEVTVDRVFHRWVPETVDEMLRYQRTPSEFRHVRYVRRCRRCGKEL